MTILNSLKIAFEGIVLNKTRTLLTMLGIIIGVASVITINWPTTIIGVNPDYLNIKIWDLQSGSMFTDVEVKSAAKVGVLEEKGESTSGQDQDDIVIAPYTKVQKRSLAIDHLMEIVASAVSEDKAQNAVDEVSEILRVQHKLTEDKEDDFHVRSMKELITTTSSTSEMLTILLVAVASISLFVGGIGIMNIMYMSVKERTKEIGLRMAVGGKGIDILMQFLIEAILISITGGILGLGSTLFIEKFLNWPTSVSLYSIIISFAVCAITGIFFGWYPARKASNLDP